MATEQHMAVYGQKRIPVPDGWTQEQVKAQMARFFPELADPKIETKKDGDKTEWVFSKKAGTKGARSTKPAAAVAGRLARVMETPIAPAWLVRAATGMALPSDAAQKSLPAIDALEAEARAVKTLATALDTLPPTWPADTEVMLL